MKNKKEGIVLVYVLFLASMSIIFATILLSNNSYLFNITKHFDLNSQIDNSIDIDSKIIVDINRSLNLNWSWFIDNMSCPDWTTITMSWNINIAHTWSFLVNDGSSIYCYATYDLKPLYIFFNNDFTGFSHAIYDTGNDMVTLTNQVGDTTFSDADNTQLYFSWYTVVPDWFDDDYNSDNYSVSSTWVSSSWTYYNDFVEDDDVLWRKTLIGYVSPDSWFKNIFWNTTKTSNVISQNINNADPINLKIWNITDWILHFDIDKNYEIKLLKFDKSIFDTSSELKRLETHNAINSSGSGYLQNNMALSSSKTGNEYSLDFANNDYAIFLKSTTTEALLYWMKLVENVNDWKDVYLIAIDDSGTGSVSYLWNEILIDDDGTFSHKHIRKIYTK